MKLQLWEQLMEEDTLQQVSPVLKMKTEVLEILVPKLEPLDSGNDEDELLQVSDHELSEDEIIAEEEILEFASHELFEESDPLAIDNEGGVDFTVPISENCNGVKIDPTTVGHHGDSSEDDWDEATRPARFRICKDGIYIVPQGVKFCRYYRKENLNQAYFATHMRYHAKGPRYICDRCSRIFACPTHFSLHKLINTKSLSCSRLLPKLLPKLHVGNSHLDLDQMGDLVKKGATFRKSGIGPVNHIRSREICAVAYRKSQDKKTSRLPSKSAVPLSPSFEGSVLTSSLEKGVNLSSCKEKYSFQESNESKQPTCETSPLGVYSSNENSAAGTLYYTENPVPTIFSSKIPLDDQVTLHQHHASCINIPEIICEGSTGKFPISTADCNSIQLLSDMCTSLQEKPVVNYPESGTLPNCQVFEHPLQPLCDSDGNRECKKLCTGEANIPEYLNQNVSVRSVATSPAPMGCVNQISSASLPCGVMPSLQALNPAVQNNSVPVSLNTSNYALHYDANHKMNPKLFGENVDLPMQPTQMGCVPYMYVKNAVPPVGNCSSTICPSTNCMPMCSEAKSFLPQITGNDQSHQPLLSAMQFQIPNSSVAPQHNGQLFLQVPQNNNLGIIILNNQSVAQPEDPKNIFPSTWMRNTPTVVIPSPGALAPRSILSSQTNLPGMQFQQIPTQYTPQFVNAPSSIVPFGMTTPGAAQVVVMNPSTYSPNQTAPFQNSFPVMYMQNQVPMPVSAPVIGIDQPCIVWQGPVASIQPT